MEQRIHIICIKLPCIQPYNREVSMLVAIRLYNGRFPATTLTLQNYILSISQKSFKLTDFISTVYSQLLAVSNYRPLDASFIKSISVLYIFIQMY